MMGDTGIGRAALEVLRSGSEAAVGAAVAEVREPSLLADVAKRSAMLALHEVRGSSTRSALHAVGAAEEIHGLGYGAVLRGNVRLRCSRSAKVCGCFLFDRIHDRP